MSEYKDDNTVDVEISNEDAGETIDIGYQTEKKSSQSPTTDELKQQAGELFKAAGGLAGSLGKFAAKKGVELKDKISDEEFQGKVKSGAKSYAEKAGSVISSGTSKAEDVIKESASSAKSIVTQKSQQNKNGKASAQGGGKDNKKLGIVLLAVGLAIAGVMALLSGGIDVQPVAEETTEETATPEEQTTETEAVEEPVAVYYSSNTEDTVKDGNKGIYAYKNPGGSYDVYYIIDFDEGFVYSFTDGNGEDYCDKVKIDFGDLNDVVMVTYDFDGELAPYGFHFKYKNNPEHLVVQDDDGFEIDFSPTNLSDALAIKESKIVTER